MTRVYFFQFNFVSVHILFEISCQVHLCEVVQLTDFSNDDLSTLGGAPRSRNLLVAVKVLRRNADEYAR